MSSKPVCCCGYVVLPDWADAREPNLLRTSSHSTSIGTWCNVPDVRSHGSSSHSSSAHLRTNIHTPHPESCCDKEINHTTWYIAQFCVGPSTSKTVVHENCLVRPRIRGAQISEKYGTIVGCCSDARPNLGRHQIVSIVEMDWKWLQGIGVPLPGTITSTQ